MGKTTFGQAGAFSAMYATDNSNTMRAERDFTAWPNSMFPVQLLNDYLSWSISVPDSYLANVDEDAVNVRIKRSRPSAGGEIFETSWALDKNTDATSGAGISVNMDLYGFSPAVIFRPAYMDQSVDLYLSGDVFEVKINGLNQPVEYTVKLFDIDDREYMAKLAIQAE
jgi:hypothetical protein